MLNPEIFMPYLMLFGGTDTGRIVDVGPSQMSYNAVGYTYTGKPYVGEHDSGDIEVHKTTFTRRDLIVDGQPCRVLGDLKLSDKEVIQLIKDFVKKDTT